MSVDYESAHQLRRAGGDDSGKLGHDRPEFTDDREAAIKLGPLTDESIDIDDYNPADDYRAVSASSVAGLALAVLSPLAVLNWWLAIIPACATVVSFLGLRQVQKRPDEYTGKGLAVAGLLIGMTSLVAGLTWQWRVYVNELPPGYIRLSYAELQPRKGDPPDSIPPEAMEYNGKKVLIKGYVYPGNRKDGITKFLLVRDQGDCCFGGNPKITDRIQVTLSDPKGCSFNTRLFKVAGTLRMQPSDKAVDADGWVFYHLDGAQLR